MNARYASVFLCFFVSMACLAIAQSASDTIRWTPMYKLKFSDFEGKPDDVDTFLATANSQSTYDWLLTGDTLYYNIFAYFLKKGSWAKSASASLMDHEQLHFDITEISTRKIKKRFQELINKKTDDMLVNRIYLEEGYKCIAMQELFDDQTRHGVDSMATKEWIYKIRKKLDSLDAYKKPIGKVPVIGE